MNKVIPRNSVLIPDGAQCAFQGVIYGVYQWEQPNFDDSVATFEMLKRPDTVAVLCIVDDKIVVLKDDQPHRGLKLSLPGGRVDDTDDSVLDAAKREVNEETGYRFKNWKLVSVVQPLAKMEWFIYTYVAWDVDGKGDAHHDPGEKIEADLKTFEEFKPMVVSGLGFLGESRDIVEGIEDLDGLKNLPEFDGVSVDR